MLPASAPRLQYLCCFVYIAISAVVMFLLWSGNRTRQLWSRIGWGVEIPAVDAASLGGSANTVLGWSEVRTEHPRILSLVLMSRGEQKHL